MNETKNRWLNLLMAAGVLLAAGGAWSSLSALSSDVAALRGEVAHLEEEVHEAGGAIKRLAAREGAVAADAEDDHEVGSHAEPRVVLDETEYDFGRIRPEDGAVTTTFIIRNDGEGDLTLGTITTSCACTSAKADTTTVVSGGEATVTVTFDPNVHEEPIDRFSRSVYIPTNDHETPEVELKVFVDIIEDE